MEGVFGAVLGVEMLLELGEKMAENYEKKARVLSYNRIYIPRFKCLCGGHVIPMCSSLHAPHVRMVLGGNGLLPFELKSGRFFLK